MKSVTIKQPRNLPVEWPLPEQSPQDVCVLIVDDQEIVRLPLTRILANYGFQILTASSAEEALQILDGERVELMLCDIHMPGMNGVELVRAMAHSIPDTAVVMVSGLDNVDYAMECLKLGAYGYVFKPFKPSDILIAVASALRHRMLELEYRDREEVLAQRVHEQTEQIRAEREELSLRLLAAAGHRDNETGAHVRRLGLYAALMARILGWSQDQVECIHDAAPTHDIGKIGVPDRVLQKEGSLTDEEWILMKAHTLMGANILKDSAVPFIQMGARIAACHHERWDGTGYPANLAGEAIPLEARIVCLLDVFDALCSRRVYKNPWHAEEAISYIRNNRGKIFDPHLVDIFLDNVERFHAIFMEVADECALNELPRR